MDLRRLDEIATAATVSPIEVEVEGWWCKAAPDLPFRRCNVAVPPFDAADDRMVFADGLDQVRRWYQGIATDVLWALRAAARGPGVEQAYLQVETDNAAAIALYEDLGFATSHDYHYRSEPEPAAGSVLVSSALRCGALT